MVTLLLGSVDALRDLLEDAAGGVQNDRAHHRTLLEKLGATPVKAPDLSTDSMGRTLRVNVEKLDRMLSLSGEIAIARGRVRALLHQHGNRDEAEELDRLSRELQEEILKVRAVPVGPTLTLHTRTVRDAASKFNKDARLVIEGEGVEVDTSVVELLRDPLTHLVRNAVGHGLETPQQRLAAGKSPCGTVTLSARHEGGFFVLEVKDDGRGFDREAIIREARVRGRNVEHLSDEELFKIPFEAGFTTATEITDLSGRGVGLDVVRHNLEKLRGNVSVQSVKGEGATLTLKLPLTLAIIDAFFVGAGGETYAIPLESMIECIDLKGDDGAAAGVLTFRDEALPWIGLSQHFGNPSTPGARRSLVVVQHGKGRAGLVVERLDGEDQTVLKPLTGLAAGARGVAGSALLGDGRVALILDVPSLLDTAVEAARSLHG
jgi:two-component system chemotaxis sensor kinase CheA